jgi:hypothetical protein
VAQPGAAPPNAAQPGGAQLVQELKVSGHLMSLPAGLFCILHEPAALSVRRDDLPAIRISLPPGGAAGVEITGFRPDGWLGVAGDAALVRVTNGPAQVLVTIYQQLNEPDSAPKLQVRQLLGGEAQGGAPTAPPQAAGRAAPQPAERFDLLAHVQGSGDRGAKFGAWLGEQGSGNWIEGFAMAPLEGFEPGDLSYQAVLGRGWLSPWVEAGQYCGSRGMALPLLGFRIRLQGAAAEAFELSASASFVDGSYSGPVGSDETCEGEKLAPLEAMSITLNPRARKPGRVKR